MPCFLLIRHASHDLLGRELVGRRSGVTLSRSGLAEAEALSRRLAQFPISEIHASPRERAIETARSIARQHGLEVRIAPELDEVDFGEWTGRSFDQLDGDPLWSQFNRDRALTRIPGGETMTEVVSRVTGLIERLAAGRLGDDDLAIVGHGDPLRVAIVSLLGLPIDAMLRLEIAPASLSILRMEQGEVRLELLNDRSHCESRGRASMRRMPTVPVAQESNDRKHRTFGRNDGGLSL